MRNNYFKRKREQEALDAGKIHVRSRLREIVFHYKGKPYRYVYESTAAYGFAYIYDDPHSKCGTCIYSTSIPSQTTDLGREVYDELIKQKIVSDAGA